jgi:tRNA pseudouridine55 synthase
MLKEGIISVNKPKGPTSHDIIYQVRRLSGIKKVGHAGTLDPLASGVLVVAIGREFTKQIDQIVKTEKEYVATVKLGENSTTDDAEGEKTVVNNELEVSREQVDESLNKFIGQIDQIPPAFSAIKIGGRKAYDMARKGQVVDMKSRQILIKEIEVIEYKWPVLEIRVVCGSGTYIRSLARDIGKELETGAYLQDLVRTRVGEYKIEDSINLDQ